MNKIDFLAALKGVIDDVVEASTESEARRKILLEILPSAPTILQDEKKLDALRSYASKKLAELEP